MLDLNYEYEPSENFKKRLKMALEGDVTMGNSQEAANVVKTKTGENLWNRFYFHTSLSLLDTRFFLDHKIVNYNAMLIKIKGKLFYTTFLSFVSDLQTYNIKLISF